MLKYAPWNWLVYIRPSFLTLAPDDLKGQEMCNKAIEKAPWLLNDVPPRLRTHEMCSRAIEKCIHPFRFIPEYIKAQKK